MKFGIYDIILTKARARVLIKILLGTNNPITGEDIKLSPGHSKIDIRYLNKLIQIRITTIITDRELSLTIEENEATSPYDTGLASYSNSDSTVFFYTSIFENLWMQSTTTILS